MSWSFSIGRLFGSDLRVHATFFLLILWIGLSAYLQAGWNAAVVNVVFVLILFACVVAHEFGHALMARRFGIRTPDVTLLPIGGMARLEKMPDRPGQEILVALAGPAVNVAIWAVLTLIFGTAGAGALADLDPGFETLPQRVAALNLILALFNMVPAFPMDGGRVLRAALAIFMDRPAATRAAARSGQALALAMGFLGLVAGNPMLVLIGFFVFIAAGAESADTALRDVARRYLARDAMVTQFETLTPEDTIDAASAALLRTTQHEFPVVDAEGRPIGFLTRAALYSALAGGHRPRVSEVMARNIPAAPLGERLDRVLEKLGAAAPAVAVTGTDGVLVGYVTRENLGELMVIAQSRQRLP